MSFGGLDPTPVRAFLEPAHLALVEELAAFVRAEIRPLPAPVDDAGARTQAREILGRLGQANLLRFLAPLDLRALCLCREALAHASPLADEVFALQGLGAMPLLLTGGHAARVAEIQAGTSMAAFAMTEPEAGSDLRALATRAVPADDGGWRLEGLKTLISNAGIADLYCVFAATDPSLGPKGVSCFLVPADRAGLRFVRPLVMSAPHPLGEVAFEACAVARGELVGQVGEGFRLGLAALDRLRPTVAAAANGMAARALDESLARARQRRQFGVPIGDHQLVQQKLARMATDLTAARLLTFRAAWEHDQRAPSLTLSAAMAKSFATETAQRIVDDAVQLHGGAGCLADHPVDRLYRSVRALRIYEGTTEIQTLVIARELARV
jgi:acyl-CoA dehydrogenase